MRAFRLGLPAVLLVVLVSSTASAQQYYGRSAIQNPAKVQRYDVERDQFHYHSNVFSASAASQPWADVPYYGNRLSQFRYLGPPGRGGIYEALQMYYDSRDLDPRKYRYRFRY